MDDAGQAAGRGFTLDELLAEARLMDAVILPPDVRAALDGRNVKRLRLLTSRNILAAMLWASRNAVQFKIAWIHYLNPEMTFEQVAGYVGCARSTVKKFLADEIIPDSIWDDLPPMDRSI